MKQQKTTSTAKKKTTEGIGSLFGRDNYMWMLIGLGVMLLGWGLMAGGASKDPNVFDPNQVYSTTRITIAPIVIIAGLIIEIIALFRNPKKS